MKRFWNASEPRCTVVGVEAATAGRTLLAVSLLCAVLVSSLAAPPTARAGSDREAEINRLLDRSGVTEMIESFANSARDQMAARSAEIESEDQKYVQEIFQAVFAVDVIRKHVVNALVSHYDSVHIAELDRWFSSDLGSRIRDEEFAAQQPEATDELLQFAQASESQPPNPERLELAKQINRARGASELSERLVTEILRGMTIGTATVSDVDGRRPTTEELEAAVASQLTGLDAMLEQQMVVSFLFTGRNLSLSDNRKYLEHLESDAGKWFYSHSGEGMVSAMVLAGRGFGNHTAAWVQDLRGAAAPGNTDELRGRAAEEGRAFAASHTAMACVDETYERRQGCKEDVCYAGARAFAESCLAASKPEAQLCKGVPATGDLARTIYWRLARCDERGTPDSFCDAAVGALQEHCANNAGG